MRLVVLFSGLVSCAVFVGLVGCAVFRFGWLCCFFVCFGLVVLFVRFVSCGVFDLFSCAVFGFG
jgi:hypothetical protein